MLQSEAPFVGRSRWEENKDIACLQLALPSNGVENYTFSERGECNKVNMISMAWDSVHGSHSFMDKTDDDISSSAVAASSQFQFNDHYACLGSEEESNWSPKGALINSRAYYDANGVQAQADERSFVLSLSRDCDDVNGLQAQDHHHCQAQLAATKPKAKDENHQAQNYGVITGSRNAPRICVDCKTTKTPLWRSGPHGPKSLCNACGIRYRKAKRALSAFGNGDQMAAYKSRLPKRKQHKIDQDEDYKFVHHKKRSRMSIPSCNKNNINVKFSAKPNPHSFQRVFAEEEKEAAVLLMALSCGLVHL